MKDNSALNIQVKSDSKIMSTIKHHLTSTALFATGLTGMVSAACYTDPSFTVQMRYSCFVACSILITIGSNNMFKNAVKKL